MAVPGSSKSRGNGVVRSCAHWFVGFGVAISGAVHAADVTWTGPDNGSWNNGTNWSGGTVPDPADNVTILGASVLVTDERVVSGAFVLNEDAQLIVSGAGASFEAGGGTDVSNSRITVMGGAMASLPNAAEYLWTQCTSALVFQVAGENSVLSLPGMTSISVNAPDCQDIQVSVLVSDGGVLSLDSLESAEAADGQQIALSWITGGQILAPDLGTLERVFLLVGEGDTANFPSLFGFVECSLTVNAGGSFSADALGVAVNSFFSIGGGESLESLTTLVGCLLTVGATGELTLPAVTTLRDTFLTLADGTSLSLPELTTLDGDERLVAVASSGTGTINAPKLTSARNVVFVASEGATLSLPSIRTYRWDRCEGGALFTTGTGATLDLSGLESLVIQNTGCPGLGYPTGATGDSMIDLSGLRSISAPAGQFVSFLASNPGTVIDLSSLVTFDATIVSFFELDSGRILRAGSGGEGEGEGEGDGASRGCPAPAKGTQPLSSTVGGDEVLLMLTLAALVARYRSGRDKAAK